MEPRIQSQSGSSPYDSISPPLALMTPLPEPHIRGFSHSNATVESGRGLAGGEEGLCWTLSCRGEDGWVGVVEYEVGGGSSFCCSCHGTAGFDPRATADT